MIRRFAIPAAAVLAALLGACNSSSDSEEDPGAAPADPDVTVSVAQHEEAGDILVDSSGWALYIAEQESNGAVLCQGGCADFWVPLTVEGSEEPTASDEVTAAVGTVDRGDGTMQVTLNGVPLYTFRDDGSPGNVTGDGLTDEFEGTTFTWHVARPDGSMGEAPPDNVGGY